MQYNTTIGYQPISYLKFNIAKLVLYSNIHKTWEKSQQFKYRKIIPTLMTRKYNHHFKHLLWLYVWKLQHEMCVKGTAHSQLWCFHKQGVFTPRDSYVICENLICADQFVEVVINTW